MNGEENDTVRAGLTWRLRPLARVIGWLRVPMWPVSNGKEAISAEIGRIISSSLDINQVYDQFSRELVKLVPFDRVAITLVDPARESFSSTYFYGTDIPERRPGRTVLMAGSFTEAVTNKNSGVLVNSLSETALAQQYPGLLPFYELGLRSFLGVPLRSKGKAIGAMMLHSAQPNFYRGNHLAEGVADQIGSAGL